MRELSAGLVQIEPEVKRVRDLVVLPPGVKDVWHVHLNRWWAGLAGPTGKYDIVQILHPTWNGGW